MKFNQNQLDLFFYTADERHSIYKKKEINHLPQEEWTKDEIFKTWRFCNVYRFLDKTTKHLYENVINLIDNCNYDNSVDQIKNIKNIFRGVIIGRFFSRIETLQNLLDLNFVYNPEKYPLAIKFLSNFQKQGFPVMTGAFIINRFSLNGKTYPKIYTPFYYINLIEKNNLIAYQIQNWFKFTPNIENLVNIFKTLPSTAGFMAYEYATDLSYSKFLYPNKPDDYYTYGNFTIGSLRGLNRLLGNKPERTKIENLKEITIELLNLWNGHVKRTHELTLDENNSLSMREVEHWLCEFDKYMRVYNKESNHLKRRY
jgi:hypothetical protein